MYAVGNIDDSIKFCADASFLLWGGIDFNDNADDSSRLEYCDIRESGSSGIHCTASSPIISNCLLFDNASFISGGGIKCEDNSNPTISQCTIESNFLSFGIGGGIYCADSSNPLIIDCEICYNNAGANGAGGGIGCSQSSPSIINCIINDNRAYFAGGVHLNGPTTSLINCEISYNLAEYQEGGGIYADDCDFYMSGCVLRGNSAPHHWGGGGFAHSSHPVIEFCEISENTSQACGGFWFQDCDVIFRNCTFSLNNGGAIYCGIEVNPTIVNSIFAGNIGNSAINFSSSVNPSVIYCDFYNNQPGNFSGGSAPFNIGIMTGVNANGDSCDMYNNIFLDPQFVEPMSGNFHLLQGSGCIDAGDPASPLDPDSTIADIGAYFFNQSAGIEPWDSSTPPAKYIILNAYPNPFNTSTIISFELKEASFIKLTVYNITGREVARLVNSYMLSGAYKAAFSGDNLPSGVYFARLQVNEDIRVKKLILTK